MDPMQFLDILDNALSEAELSELCRQFGVAFAAFPGATKRDRTREFLGYVRRQGRMAGLAEATVALRPDLDTAVAGLYAGKEQELAWLDQIAGGEGRPLDSGLTWRWPGATATPPSAAPELDPPLPVAPANPYSPGSMVTDAAMFFGRAAEREQIRRLLTEGGHVAIIGGRGMGGSSLLYRAAEECTVTSGQLAAVIDLRDPAHHTLPGLLNAVWCQWWARVKPDNAVTVATLAEFVTATRKLNAAGYRPLLFLDEFEQLVWRDAAFDDHLFDAWHELGHEGLMGLALTGHTPPADLLAQQGFKTRFYELFRQLDLGLLDGPSARDVLAVPLQRAGLAAPNDAIEHLLAQAGPHPFFLHLAGLYLFDSVAHSTYSRAEVNRQFEAAAEPFWQEMWESLSPLAQAHYPVEQARGGDGLGGRQQRILATKGLLLAEETGVRPFSEGFARWLRRMQAAMQAAAEATAGAALANSA